MALPLARLLLPALPACQCQPPLRLRFPERHVAPAAARSRGHRGAFAARAAASAPAAPAPAAPEAEEQVGPRTRLVAQNIPWDYTGDDMRALFEKHGSVVGVELSMYNASKNRGLAFVTMGSEEEALAALNNLNSTTLDDRKIKVDFARPRKKQPKQVKQPVVVSDSTEKYILFVGNLTWRVRNRHLRELFASAPGVLSAEVIFHTTTPRRSAGYAFVSFSSKEAAEAAISSLNGQKLMGRPINVMFKEESAKKNESSVPKEEEAEEESSEQSDS
ncbi:hypothetical protein SETIT_6G186800v2 [Setaria italica]|uniref:RRM domain-containing protein n=1 Tax=Setaria italica TaxID=4555 RepID=K3YJ27_SETIT|nr:RNA-binding protein CP33, chloroplastic [Setaria italica]RCV31547.1 hypothetical protein SETIT_6G186800v2 [Setaria italica]